MFFVISYVLILLNQVDNDEVFDDRLKDWNNYDLIRAEKKQSGPGEQGQAYQLPMKFNKEKDSLYKVNGFNARASDDIALNRSLFDLRHQK